MNRRNFLKGFVVATTVAALAPVSLVEVSLSEAKTRFVSFEEIARITLEKYRPVLADALLSMSPRSRWSTFSMFEIPKGTDIVEPIIRS